MIKMADKTIEHGIDHLDDPNFCTEVNGRVDEVMPNGKVNTSKKTVKLVRDRVTDENGNVTYTDWKQVPEK